jgi:hypothetical protein
MAMLTLDGLIRRRVVQVMTICSVRLDDSLGRIAVRWWGSIGMGKYGIEAPLPRRA